MDYRILLLLVVNSIALIWMWREKKLSDRSLRSLKDDHDELKSFFDNLKKDLKNVQQQVNKTHVEKSLAMKNENAEPQEKVVEKTTPEVSIPPLSIAENTTVLEKELKVGVPTSSGWDNSQQQGSIIAVIEYKDNAREGLFSLTCDIEKLKSYYNGKYIDNNVVIFEDAATLYSSKSFETESPGKVKLSEDNKYWAIVEPTKIKLK